MDVAAFAETRGSVAVSSGKDRPMFHLRAAKEGRVRDSAAKSEVFHEDWAIAAGGRVGDTVLEAKMGFWRRLIPRGRGSVSQTNPDEVFERLVWLEKVGLLDSMYDRERGWPEIKIRHLWIEMN
jgi:hypothetical protein